jgi:hypothetical protein
MGKHLPPKKRRDPVRTVFSRRALIRTGDEIIADTPGRSDSMHAGLSRLAGL